MTNILNQIKADREAGTPGPWRWIGGKMRSVDGCIIDSASYEGMWFSRYNDAEDDANARRIARVPDIEAALLAAGELANAVYYFDQVGDQQSVARIFVALAAFRKAIEVKE